MKPSMTASTMAYLGIGNKGCGITCEQFMRVDDSILSDVQHKLSESLNIQIDIKPFQC